MIEKYFMFKYTFGECKIHASARQALALHALLCDKATAKF
jgi:hypothetical protein